MRQIGLAGRMTIRAKRRIHALLALFGVRLVRVNVATGPSYGLDTSFFPLLQRLGFAPKHIVDVGANRGYWTRHAVKYFPDAIYTLVEPQDHLKYYIEDLIARGRQIRWVTAGCSDCPGTLPLTVGVRDDSSTFVPSDRNRPPGSQQINVPVTTLNQIVSSSSAPLPDMVKIDAEGFDLKVLAGASDLFGKTDIFLVEALVRIGGSYENSVAEVVSFMAKAGYHLMDVTDLNRSPRHGVLWLCEFAFLREGSPLLDAATSYE